MAQIAKQQQQQQQQQQCSESRSETTLGKLTQRFIELLYKSNFTVNLNEVSTQLNIKKRRLYDITNVLEGVGLLQKTSKNVTKWNGQYTPLLAKPHPPAPPIINIKQEPIQQQQIAHHTTPSPTHPSSQTQQQQHITTREDLAPLLEMYKALEETERRLEAELQAHLQSEYAFVTYNDIKSCFENQTVIAVKAPPESELRVSEQLQIFLKSEVGPIEVYLCPVQTQPHTNDTPMNTNTSSNTISYNHGIAASNTTIAAQQQHDPPAAPLPSTPTSYTGISSDEGRGTSNTDQQYDPTLSSARSTSEDDQDTLRFLHFESREDYNFGLDEDYTTSSLFPDDDLNF